MCSKDAVAFVQSQIAELMRQQREKAADGRLVVHLFPRAVLAARALD